MRFESSEAVLGRSIIKVASQDSPVSGGVKTNWVEMGVVVVDRRVAQWCWPEAETTNQSPFSLDFW